MRHIACASLACMALGLGTLSVPLSDSKIRLPWAQPKEREWPIMNLPLHLRQENWLGWKRQGSCVHASWTMLLRWQHQYEWADYWKRKYGDGEYYAEMAQRLDAEGIRWAGTNGQNDVSFLEWACRTRRGCMVTVMGGAHMVCLVNLDSQYATLLDNNDIEKYHRVPRDEFLRIWYNSNSWAMTPVYTPAPPLEKRT